MKLPFVYRIILTEKVADRLIKLFLYSNTDYCFVNIKKHQQRDMKLEDNMTDADAYVIIVAQIAQQVNTNYPQFMFLLHRYHSA
jgi:hypothetical protein